MWGGANNFFVFTALTPPASINTTSITVNASAAATTEVANASAIVGLGAKKLVVLNLPDLGSTPIAIAGGASAISAASFYSGVYNATQAAGLTALAASAPGVNIVQADIASLFRVVIANASTYGFTNTTGFCGFNGGAACNGFVFADSVHPTEAAYRIVAQYVGLLSDPTPTLVQASRLGETGLLANQIITNQVFDRLSAFVSGTYVDRNGPYLEIVGSYGTHDGSGNGPDLALRIGGIRAGLDKKSGASVTGGSVTMLSGVVSTGATEADIAAYRADAYSTALFGNTYVSGNAGISSISLTGIERDTGITGAKATASTGGYVATVAAEVGYVASFGRFTVIPSGRLTYFHAKTQAYDEAAPLLAMSFNDRETDAVLAGAKVRAVTAIAGLGLASTAFGEIGYEGFVSSTTNNLTATFVGNTALPTTVNPGDPSGPGVVGKVGLSSQIAQGAFVDFQYGLSLHDNGGETHLGDVRLKATY